MQISQLRIVEATRSIHLLSRGDVQLLRSHAKLCCPCCGSMAIISLVDGDGPYWDITCRQPLSMSPAFDMPCCGVNFLIHEGDFQIIKEAPTPCQ